MLSAPSPLESLGLFKLDNEEEFYMPWVFWVIGLLGPEKNKAIILVQEILLLLIIFKYYVLSSFVSQDNSVPRKLYVPKMSSHFIHPI